MVQWELLKTFYMQVTGPQSSHCCTCQLPQILWTSIHQSSPQDNPHSYHAKHLNGTMALPDCPPLRLSYAMTIHKSQGQTLDKAVINIGSKERAAGCTFVAISHLRHLSDGPMSFE
jgi:hypothetical protein